MKRNRGEETDPEIGGTRRARKTDAEIGGHGDTGMSR